MKRSILLFSLLSIAVFAVLLFCYPERLRMMEANDFFVTTPEFLSAKIAQPPGLTNIIYNFLLQFFRWPVVGAIIEALLLFLVSLGCAFLPGKIKKQSFTELAIAPALALLLLFPNQVNVYFEAVIFFAALNAYLVIKKQIWRYLFVVLFTIPGFFLLSWSVLALLYVVFAICEYAVFKTKYYALIPIACLLITIAYIYLSNAALGFIPFEKRFFFSPSDSVNWAVYLLIYAASLLLLLIPRKSVSRWMDWSIFGVGVIAIAVCMFVIKSNKEDQLIESSYTLSRLADEGRWAELLDETKSGEISQNKMTIAYALLAESALEQLPQNLFTYPISSTDDFLFEHEMNPYYCNFNRLFYANLGIYDEAFHQSFEYGVQMDEGVCFKSLKEMVDYAMKVGDFRLADKYLDQLDHASLYSSWVDEKRAAIAATNRRNTPMPERADNFVGGYPFNSEMVRLLQEDTTNVKKLDYLLCGLLIDKMLDKFRIIIRAFPIYKGKDLPKAYAEAAAMMASQNGSIHDMFQYSPDYDKQFLQFYDEEQKGDNQSNQNNYRGSYWSYYFYVDNKAAQQMEGKPSH